MEGSAGPQKLLHGHELLVLAASFFFSCAVEMRDESAIEQIRKYAPTERQKLEMHRLALSAKQDKPAYDRKRACLLSSRMWKEWY